jgi:hypothetical protein
VKNLSSSSSLFVTSQAFHSCFECCFFCSGITSCISFIFIVTSRSHRDEKERKISKIETKGKAKKKHFLLSFSSRLFACGWISIKSLELAPKATQKNDSIASLRYKLKFFFSCPVIRFSLCICECVWWVAWALKLFKIFFYVSSIKSNKFFKLISYFGWLMSFTFHAVNVVFINFHKFLFSWRRKKGENEDKWKEQKKLFCLNTQVSRQRESFTFSFSFLYFFLCNIFLFNSLQLTFNYNSKRRYLLIWALD